MIELNDETKERIQVFKEKLERDHREYVEKYKHIHCSYHGCGLWSHCSTKCNGLYDDHVEGCEAWVWGWRHAVAEHTGNVSPY